MLKAILKVLQGLGKYMGILILYTGLVLAASRSYLWGVLLFGLGVFIQGFQEEGWNK